jgi:type I restriction enzyme S subunit
MKRGKLKDRDILVYKDGAYIGRTSLFQDGFPHQIASVNEHVFLVHTLNESFQYYLFFTLYQHEYYLKMQKLNKNAAQPGINSKAMLSLEILLPPLELIQKFDEFITPVMKIIFAKAKENRELVDARDRLLPKLMSGELEV